MNERELSLIQAIGESVREQLQQMERRFDETIAGYAKQVQELTEEIETLRSAPQPDIKAMIADAASELPQPVTPELPDIPALVKSAVSSAVAEIPAPQDGRSVTMDDVVPVLHNLVNQAVAALPVPDVKSMVADAVSELPQPVTPELPDIPALVKSAVSSAVAEIPAPQDGRSVTMDDVVPVLRELVNEAMKAIPAPQPGKPGDAGRDALQLEIMPSIDEQKSYPRGTYATHNGGLWRAFEKTAGLRGWECIVDGVAGVDIALDGQRSFAVTVLRASGSSERKEFDVPVMIYRGVFKSGDEYRPGDTVTWAGSLWHCDEQTSDKPGEVGSKGWTLAAKRGRDAR